MCHHLRGKLRYHLDLKHIQDLNTNAISSHPYRFSITVKMTKIADIEAANAQYAASFTKGHLPIPPKRYVRYSSPAAINLTNLANWPSSPAWTPASVPPLLPSSSVLPTSANKVDVFSALGLTEGDAHIIRNAGGRASEALRSLIISQRLLGTEEVVVIHHVSHVHSILV